jgi:hypothetical protein
MGFRNAKDWFENEQDRPLGTLSILPFWASGSSLELQWLGQGGRARTDFSLAWLEAV